MDSAAAGVTFFEKGFKTVHSTELRSINSSISTFSSVNCKMEQNGSGASINILCLYASESTAKVSQDADKDYTHTVVTEQKLNSLPLNSFNEVKYVGGIPDEDVQGKILTLLRPLGKLVVTNVADREAGQALAVDLKIQGFLDIMAAKDPASGERFVVCQKPGFDVGATAAVKIAPTTAPAKWKMDTGDLADSDLIDENELLDKDFKVPAPSGGCGDVVGGKKRACKDCTCGLAEAEAAENVAANASSTIEEKVVRASSCGNCAKGDAFRCAGCPFRGKPAFEPGNERVVLAMGDDDI